jgi:hypothetical protein
LTEDLTQYNVPLDKVRIIINTHYISYLRVLTTNPIHNVSDTIIRDTMFRLLVERGNMKAEVVDKFLHKECIQIFREAFTHDSAGETYDYELWETIGDGNAKGFLRCYLLRRFPELRTSEQPSYMITKAAQRYEDKSFFSKMFSYLKLDALANYKEQIVSVHKYRIKKGNLIGDPDNDGDAYFHLRLDKSMKEDMFEAFFASLQYAIDLYIQQGLGNAVCYNIFSSLYDEQEMTVDVASLENSFTLLKEIFDKSPAYNPSAVKIYGNDNRIDKMDDKSPPEPGSGEYTGMTRIKLKLIFRPDREGRGRGLIKNLKEPLIKEIYGDYTFDEPKFSAAEKALEWLKQEHNIVHHKAKSS